MKPATLAAVVVFAALAVVHAVRLAIGFEVVVAGNVVPRWVSLPGVLVPAALAWGLWRDAPREPRAR